MEVGKETHFYYVEQHFSGCTHIIPEIGLGEDMIFQAQTYEDLHDLVENLYEKTKEDMYEFCECCDTIRYEFPIIKNNKDDENYVGRGIIDLLSYFNDNPSIEFYIHLLDGSFISSKKLYDYLELLKTETIIKDSDKWLCTPFKSYDIGTMIGANMHSLASTLRNKNTSFTPSEYDICEYIFFQIN